MRAFIHLYTIRSLLRPSMTLALFMQRKRGRRCFSGSSPSGPVRQVHLCVRGAPTAAGALRTGTNSARGTVRCRFLLFCCQMACEVAGFLEQFPGAVDIVLVKSERWTEYHKAIMEALTEGVRMFLRTRRHLPFEEVLEEFKEIQPLTARG